MTISIKPTTPRIPEDVVHQPSVMITVTDDDLNIHEVLELVRAALLAWGFMADIIDDGFRTFNPND